MASARRLHHSYEQYLATLEMSGVKLEYCDGEMYAMAAGGNAHARFSSRSCHCALEQRAARALPRFDV